MSKQDEIMVADDIDIFSIPETETAVSIEQQVEDIAETIEGRDIFDTEDDEESIEESTEDNEDDEEFEEDVQVSEANLVPLLGAQLIKDGALPENFDLSSKTSHKEIYEAYKNSVQEQVEKDILNDIQNKLTEEGITEDTLYHAKLISTGTSPETIGSIITEKSYSEQEFEGVDSKENVDLVKNFLKRTNKGSQRIVDKMIETALMDDDDFKDLFNEGKEFFKASAKEQEDRETQRYEQARANREQIIRRNQEAVQDIITKGEVLGLKIPNIKKFTSSISENTEVVEIRGEQRRVTPLGKFLIEFQNNPELQIAAFLQHSFGGEIIERAVSEGEQKGETNLLKNFSMVQERGISKKQVTNLTNKKQKDGGASKSYFFQTNKPQ